MREQGDKSIETWKWKCGRKVAEPSIWMARHAVWPTARTNGARRLLSAQCDARELKRKFWQDESPGQVATAAVRDAGEAVCDLEDRRALSKQHGYHANRHRSSVSLSLTVSLVLIVCYGTIVSKRSSKLISDFQSINFFLLAYDVCWEGLSSLFLNNFIAFAIKSFLKWLSFSSATWLQRHELPPFRSSLI